jgi:DNA-binding transcriptional ArsR family regulator
MVKRDVAVLRALGSSVRQNILESLDRAPATSAMLARAWSSSTGVMSYHLRQLGNAGLIEVDRRVGRSVYWRLSPTDAHLADPAQSDPQAAAQAAGDELFAWFTASVQRFRDGADLEPEWHDAALFAVSASTLTVSELTAFGADYLQLLRNWSGRIASAPDARAIRIALFAYPDSGPRPQSTDHG